MWSRTATTMDTAGVTMAITTASAPHRSSCNRFGARRRPAIGPAITAATTTIIRRAVSPGPSADQARGRVHAGAGPTMVSTATPSRCAFRIWRWRQMV